MHHTGFGQSEGGVGSGLIELDGRRHSFEVASEVFEGNRFGIVFFIPQRHAQAHHRPHRLHTLFPFGPAVSEPEYELSVDLTGVAGKAVAVGDLGSIRGDEGRHVIG